MKEKRAPKPSVRVYGPVLRGSWSTVTSGFRQALQSHGGLDGVVPIDDLDPDASYPGATADAGLVIGHASNTTMARRLGMHRVVYLMFAPNTLTLPKHLVESLLRACDVLLVPSDEAMSTMRRHGVEERRLHLVKHGVDVVRFEPADHPDPDGVFTILHHAGSAFERKGTLELIEAFRGWRHRKDARLLISAPAASAHLIDADVATWLQAGRPQAASIQYHHAHVVCQPSRGEGFGLVPFEARACGRPCLVTACGQQACAALDASCVIEYSQNQTPLACELFEPAPDVPVEAIRKALTYCYERRRELLAEAMRTAEEFRTRWSWSNVTSDWYCHRIPSDLMMEGNDDRLEAAGG